MFRGTYAISLATIVMLHMFVKAIKDSSVHFQLNVIINKFKYNCKDKMIMEYYNAAK